jgi:hypothetical protein
LDRDLALGAYPWNSSIPFVLEFVNRSAQPVRIAAIQKSCGCTALNEEELVGRELQPHETVALNGVIQANEMLGIQRQTIDLMLESGLVRSAEMEYELYRTYEVTPTEIAV